MTGEVVDRIGENVGKPTIPTKLSKKQRVKVRREEIRRLSMESKTQPEIASIFGCSLRTVERDIAEIRKQTIIEIKRDDAVLPTRTVRESLDEKKSMMMKALAILDSPAPTMRDGTPVDDRRLRLEAIKVAESISNDLDRLFGMADAEVRRVLDEFQSEVEGYKRAVANRLRMVKADRSARPGDESRSAS